MSLLLFALCAMVLLYLGMAGTNSFMALVISVLIGCHLDHWHPLSLLTGLLLLAGARVLMFATPLRRERLSRPLLGWVRSRLPHLSDTESEALKSGSVDWDGELFSGRPQWQKLLDFPHGRLSEEERAFINGPLNTLCGMIDDWKITHELFDLPADVWDYIRKQGFFGLVIPREFGGKGFSEMAHSEIVMRLSTRGVSAAVTVMVPNSLGPGELLVHYGTDEQKTRYLPGLASGDIIPCFALTSPMAGSDAGAIPDKGIICKGHWQGKEVLGLKVTWNKRYITLAPVATLIGLAIKVYDPDGLVGNTEDIGITCVLMPGDLPGVNSGPRHLPMNTAFMNGPTWGNDVFIPMEQVIGGQPMLGKGWIMLLECLSIGRSISLPALATGAGKLASLGIGSYARVREQFGRTISQFEGVQEALEPIAGYTYMMDAARLLTASMLDRGVRPSVPSAVLKSRNTELMRIVVNHAMDVVAGRGVITGPRNFIAQGYEALPIGITVEGANILTRSLMIFGQGAIRCHPFIVEEIEAANMTDENAAVEKFDGIFYRHAAHTMGNAVKAFALALTRGRLASVPKYGMLQPYYRQLTRFSAAFAVVTDVSLLSIGGDLKARQRLSGRMADCLTRLYYASAVIKQWHEENYPLEHKPLVEWCLQQCLHDLDTQMRHLIANFPVRALRWPLRLMIVPPGTCRLPPPDDRLAATVAKAIVQDNPVRDRLTQGVYRSDSQEDPLGRVLNAFQLANQTQEMRDRLHKEIRSAKPKDRHGVELLMGHQWEEMAEWAVNNNIIGAEERPALLQAIEALYDVIRVDAFDAEALRAKAESVQGKHKLVERTSSSLDKAPG
jgi:acyl-CoA dehydrogenase